jgi:hypothetical protein
MEAWSSARSIRAMRLAIATRQGGVRRVLPLAARRLAKMGGTMPEQPIAFGEDCAAGALADKADRQRADMKFSLQVAQPAGAAPLDLARADEPFLERRPGQGRAWGMHGRSPRRRAKAFSRLTRSSPNPPRPFPLLFPALPQDYRLPNRSPQRICTFFFTPKPGLIPGRRRMRQLG